MLHKTHRVCAQKISSDIPYFSLPCTMFPSSPAAPASFHPSIPRISISSKNRNSIPTIASLSIGVEDIVALAHNKVLVASSIACAIGQLSKPLTSSLSGRGIDLRMVVSSGGMPSSHSSAVVAAATALGLERGLSDSVFGMSVVFAGLVMYDAQGVRREAGNHAKLLNRILTSKEKSISYQEDDPDDSKSSVSFNSEDLPPMLARPKKHNFYTSNLESDSSNRTTITSSKLGAMPDIRINGEEPKEKTSTHIKLLNESVGHTEIQVIVGAVLGFAVSLIVDTIL